MYSILGRKLQAFCNSPWTSSLVHLHHLDRTDPFSYCSQHIPGKGKTVKDQLFYFLLSQHLYSGGSEMFKKSIMVNRNPVVGFHPAFLSELLINLDKTFPMVHDSLSP